MKYLVIFCCIFLLCALASPVHGEIYAWTDAKGIMHFTNYHPPPQAKLFKKDVRPPSPETEVDQQVKAEAEQPAAERAEIHEYFEEKLDETVRRIEDFERNLEEAEILNRGLTRKLIQANQRADSALAYAEELEYKVREAATLPYSNTLNRSALYRYPTRYRYGYAYTIHKSGFKNKRFHSKRHSIGRHHKQFSKKSHRRSIINKSRFSIQRGVGIHNTHQIGSRHFSKPRSAGGHQKRQFGSSHVRKSHRVGFRSSDRVGHRNFRK
jgi:hypothetical protein